MDAPRATKRPRARCSTLESAAISSHHRGGCSEIGTSFSPFAAKECSVQSFRPRRHRRPQSPVISRAPLAPSSIVPAVVLPLPSDEAVDASAFTSLGVSRPLVTAVVQEGYSEPTPIQTAVIPALLEGRDVLACAQTGTGKTAAFVLPLLDRLMQSRGNGRIRALVLTPTRELAAQIAERATAYGRHLPLRNAVIYGGVGQQKQEDALRRQPDLLVATPGRLLDLIGQGIVRLDAVEHYVLDEADRMLDMGFVHDVRRITALLPKQRQTLLFSATMPSEVEQLTRTILVDPVRVAVKPPATTAELIDQSVVFVERADKRAVLEKVLCAPEVSRAMVFTRTKHGANRLREQLEKAGIGAGVIHGNKSQGARERALEAFRAGSTRVLVATDIAARGIDVDGVSHVINYDLPEVAEAYVHRIGRTARAGASGRAISLVEGEDRAYLRQIERLIRMEIPTLFGDRPAEQRTDTRPASPRGGRPQHFAPRRRH
ncbi:MAG: DEAD/DEAH box helicase [Deltaproteobacteria bacterium]|nr:DEAD/DEAH box helicase [Deltaproteobacteria bacterium]